MKEWRNECFRFPFLYISYNEMSIWLSIGVQRIQRISYYIFILWILHLQFVYLTTLTSYRIRDFYLLYVKAIYSEKTETALVQKSVLPRCICIVDIVMISWSSWIRERMHRSSLSSVRDRNDSSRWEFPESLDEGVSDVDVCVVCCAALFSSELFRIPSQVQDHVPFLCVGWWSFRCRWCCRWR